MFNQFVAKVESQRSENKNKKGLKAEADCS